MARPGSAWIIEERFGEPQEGFHPIVMRVTRPEGPVNAILGFQDEDLAIKVSKRYYPGKDLVLLERELEDIQNAVAHFQKHGNDVVYLSAESVFHSPEKIRKIESWE
ncbi:hypothetical protein D3C87_818660 [compost metagenome]